MLTSIRLLYLSKCAPKKGQKRISTYIAANCYRQTMISLASDSPLYTNSDRTHLKFIDKL